MEKSLEAARIKNDTFCPGQREFNACVGTNGGSDIYAYATGFLESAEALLIDVIVNQRHDCRDTWIYPIVFNARHGLELTLKQILSEMVGIRPKITIDLQHVGSTHDLEILWTELKGKALLIDRRYSSPIDLLDQHVRDYIEIDPTGQAFRYPDNKYKKLHLKNISLINLKIFQERFHELKKLLGDLYYLTRDLVSEYALGTYTDALSRKDIESIAKKLPPIDQWGSDAFNLACLAIRAKYELSQRKLIAAINIIKDHPTFSSYIGAPPPDLQARKLDFEGFLQQWLHFNHVQCSHEKESLNYSVGTDTDNIVQARFSYDFLKEMPVNVLAEIGAIFHLGRDLKNCELYSGCFISNLSEIENNIDDYIIYYLSKINFKDDLFVGLKLLGHDALVEELKLIKAFQ